MISRTGLGRAAVAVVAGVLLALAHPLMASADVPTEVQVTFDPSAPISNQNVEATAFIDWQTGPPPAGWVTFHVEDTGYTITIPTVTSATTHYTTATTSVGEFIGGSHVIDATFVSSLAGFTGSTSKTSIAVQGIVGTKVFVGFPSTITVGKSVAVDGSLLLPSTAYNPGGTIAFAVAGKSVGSCVPAPGALKNTYGCSVSAPAPTHSGTYPVTATFSQSPYFADASGSVSGTAKAAAAAPVAAPSAVPTATPTTATAVPSASATPAGAPPAGSDLEASSQTATSASPWPLVLVATLGALLGAGVVVLVIALRRRRLSL